MRTTTPAVQLDAFAHLLLGPPTASEVLAQIQAWVYADCLRPLDWALANFVCQSTQDAATPELLLATALCAHMEGRGHTCLSLHLPGSADMQPLQHWSASALAALRKLLERLPVSLEHWHHTLRTSSAVHDTGASCTPFAGPLPRLTCAPGEGLANPNQSAPLVLTPERLYLRRYWQMEQGVTAHLRQRLSVHAALDTGAVRTQLTRIFPQPVSTEFDWQKFACANALRSHLSLITGGPGTGKTYTAARLLSLLHRVHTGAQPLRVGLGAPTGKAAARLKQSIDAAFAALPAPQPPSPAARTLHAWLGARPHTRQFVHRRSNPLPLDVFVIDEVSMLHLEMLHSVLEALAPHTRLILMGDPDQLTSVEAGAVLGDLAQAARKHRYTSTTAAYALATTGQTLPADACDSLDSLEVPDQALSQHAVQLQRSHRFCGPIGQLALAVNQGNAVTAQTLLQTLPNKSPHDPLHWVKGSSNDPGCLARLASLALQGYRAYTSTVQQGPINFANHAAWVQSVLTAFDQFRILCAVREGPLGVAGLNSTIENALLAQGLLRCSSTSSIEGRPVLVTRNDADLGVFNGDIGIALRSSAAKNAPLRIYFPLAQDASPAHSISPHRLPDVQAAYAMTVHKSQGSEFEHTVLVLPSTSLELVTRELLYTGITRAKKAFTLVTPEPGIFADALARPTQRYSGLDVGGMDTH
jgi:exodeoxyribonuclease V alpha subunit